MALGPLPQLGAVCAAQVKRYSVRRHQNMNWDAQEWVVRYARLPEELKPLPIYPADTLDPIAPDWLAITRAISRSERVPSGIEGYVLYFLLDDGTCLASEQYETLQVAIDQAKATVGIGKDEWCECRVKVTAEDGTIRWSDVA
jgi:hypothetical protein